MGPCRGRTALVVSRACDIMSLSPCKALGGYACAEAPLLHIHSSVTPPLLHMRSCIEFTTLVYQSRLQALHEVQEHAQAERAAAEQHLQQALAAQRHESEEAVGRHLSFIDRLMADKDELSRQLAALGEALKVSCRAKDQGSGFSCVFVVLLQRSQNATCCA